MTDYFCTASDIKCALLLRQSVSLVNIGGLLAEMVQEVRLYDEDTSTLGRIEREIRLMREADKIQRFNIRFDSLKKHRSKFSPARGESFAEKHRFLESHIEEYLEDRTNLTDAANQFLVDPASLRENRLSQFFLV